MDATSSKVFLFTKSFEINILPIFGNPRKYITKMVVGSFRLSQFMMLKWNLLCRYCNDWMWLWPFDGMESFLFGQPPIIVNYNVIQFICFAAGFTVVEKSVSVYLMPSS